MTENNLARALGVQQFAGGRLGTLLLERGSVSEEDLGKALALQHGCEAVAWRLLADVPATTIAALPAKFAIKHSAIPYDRTESAIRLALRDPADLRILDELFFVTGRKIIPGVAPEVRIYQALEKYYGERRTPRYAILAEKLSRPARPARSPASPAPPPSFYPDPARSPVAAPEPAEIWGDSSDHDLASGPAILESWNVPEPRGGWAGTASPAGSRSTGEIEAISWEEMPPGPSLWTNDSAPVAPPAEANAATVAPPAPAPSPPPSRAPAALPTARDFTAVAAAKDRDSIAGAAIEALGTRFEKAALFVARPDGVAGWSAGGKVDARAIRLIAIPWTDASLFLNVRLSRSFYLGPLLKLPRHEALARAVGGWPEECVLMPVLIREKPVAFLYAEADRERGVTPMDLVFLRELAEAVAAAFAESIRLRKKEI